MKLRSLSVDASNPLVERDAEGLPVAFRIWKSGANPTSDGVDYFTEASAAALSHQQGEVGHEFGFDFNHLTWKDGVDPTHARASGFHQIQVRYPDGSAGYEPGKIDPELWAVACRWTAEARGMLAQDPPLYRYFSPAFMADEMGAICKYLNCALTNIPATYGIPSLRSATATATEGTKMEIEHLLEILGVTPEELDGLDDDGVLALIASKMKPADEIEASADDVEMKADAPEAEEPKAKSADSPMADAPEMKSRAVRMPAPRRVAPTRVVTEIGGFRACSEPKLRAMCGLEGEPMKKLPRNVQTARDVNNTVFYIFRNSGDVQRYEQIQAAQAVNNAKFGRGAL